MYLRIPAQYFHSSLMLLLHVAYEIAGQRIIFFSFPDSFQSVPAAVPEFALADFSLVGRLETDQNIRCFENLIWGGLWQKRCSGLFLQSLTSKSCYLEEHSFMVSSSFQNSKGQRPCGMSHCLASYYSVDAALLWCSFADPICEDDIYSPRRTMGRSFRDKCYHNSIQFLFSDTQT